MWGRKERRGAEDDDAVGEDCGANVFITFAPCVIPCLPTSPSPPRGHMSRPVPGSLRGRRKISRCRFGDPSSLCCGLLSLSPSHCEVRFPLLSPSLHIGIPRNTFPFQLVGRELLPPPPPWPPQIATEHATPAGRSSDRLGTCEALVTSSRNPSRETMQSLARIIRCGVGASAHCDLPCGRADIRSDHANHFPILLHPLLSPPSYPSPPSIDPPLSKARVNVIPRFFAAPRDLPA